MSELEAVGVSETLTLGRVSVYVWVAEDGAPVVQIDTDDEEEAVSEIVRVYLNDARASQWMGEDGRTEPGAELSL